MKQRKKSIAWPVQGKLFENEGGLLMKVKEMFRKGIALTLTAAMLLGLSACGQSGESSADNAAAENEAAETGNGESNAAENETDGQAEEAAGDTGAYDIDSYEVSGITVKLYSGQKPDGGDPESDYFLEKVEEWNAQDNGITIEPIFISTEKDYLDRLSTDLASGDAPDVFYQYGGTNCLEYVKSDIILNLTPYLDNNQEWKEGIVKANWDPVTFDKFGYEGIYGVPFSAYEIFLYYNEEYLEACNLEVPKSWEDLEHCCEVLQENGYQPFLFGEGANYKYGHFISTLAAKAYGPDFQDALAAREYTYESPEVLELMQRIKDLQDKGYFGENILSVDAAAERTYFGAGDSAFMMDLSRGGAVLADTECFEKQTIHVAKFPYINEEYATVNMGGASSSYFVCTMGKSEEQVKASLKVLKWLTSQEFIDGLVQRYANTYSVIPSDGIIDNYLFKECNDLMGETTKYVQELAQVSTNTAELTVVRDALQLLVSGSTPEEVGKEIMENLANYE